MVRRGGRELCGPGAPLFVDLTPEPDDLAFLRERFGFHPLALEDAAGTEERTKYEEYPESTFVVVHRIGPSPTDEGLQARELHAFLARDALVTIHASPIGEVDALLEQLAGDASALGRGSDYVLYRLLDAITDAHFAVADHLTDEIEELADEVTSDATDEPRDPAGARREGHRHRRYARAPALAVVVVPPPQAAALMAVPGCDDPLEGGPLRPAAMVRR